uniref:tRNA (cytosine(38)-C(5))-methyltransferase n=1 Tax=Mastacembelus armatus TaxID=205130 RepID=A0A3Q3MXI5_9TELE
LEPFQIFSFHYGIPAQVVAAIDINTTANQVYRHNFPDTPLWNKTIEGISLDDFNKLSFDMILMSPPCQPFTRIGRQGDVQDPRTKSFLYILDLLPRLSRLPRFFLLENVKGFETSSARDLMVQTLKDCGYTFEEIMVSPTSVGIPNSRLRYYLLAKISPENVGIQTSSESQILRKEGRKQNVISENNWWRPEEEIQRGRILYKLETTTDAQRKENQNNDLSVRQIQDYLEPQSEINMELYLLPPKTLLRYALLMDIVQPTCRRSTCFTKGYGWYVEGTGSVLQCSEETEVSLTELLNEPIPRLLKLKLRYFTPREVANLMGFPQSFSFPAQVPTKQQYKVLGNSLNVVVVAKLLRQLVS